MSNTDWLQEAFVDQLISEHCSGAADHQYLLFLLVSLDRWYQVFILEDQRQVAPPPSV